MALNGIFPIIMVSTYMVASPLPMQTEFDYQEFSKIVTSEAKISEINALFNNIHFDISDLYLQLGSKDQSYKNVTKAYWICVQHAINDDDPECNFSDSLFNEEQYLRFYKYMKQQQMQEQARYGVVVHNNIETRDEIRENIKLVFYSLYNWFKEHPESAKYLSTHECNLRLVRINFSLIKVH